MANVILIGCMGCGKSSVAVKLSYRLKQSMTDTDRWIEKKQGKTITEIFEQDGEEAFRQMETDALKYLKETAKNQVISVGGGMPVREENRALMKEIGKVVYLRATAETLYERVREDGARPLLQCENPLERIRNLLEERKEAYESAADIIIDVDGKSFGQILYEIDGALRPEQKQGAGYRGRMQGERPEGRGPLRSLLGGAAKAQDAQGAGKAAPEAQTGSDTGSAGEAAAVGAAEAPERAAGENAADGAEEAKGGAKRLKKLLVINGPNLNFLGIREKAVYGTKDYNDLLDMIARKAVACRIHIEVFQSNHEGAIIDRIQQAYFDGSEGLIINPGAYTHYSYAIFDALNSVPMPKVEVHISNIMEREAFRQVSVTAPACDKQIYGHGLEGYLEAVDFIMANGFGKE